MLQEMVDFMLKKAAEYQAIFLCYTHVKSRNSKENSYESGSFPEGADYVGSRAFQNFCQFGYSLARQTTDAPPELKNATGVRVTLNRQYGDTGEIWCQYEHDTTRLVELPDGKPQPASEKQKKAARREWDTTVDKSVEAVIKGDEPKAKKGGLNRLGMTF